MFNNYSLGVGTNRDAWCYQYNKNKLKGNILKTINFYNKNLSESDHPIIDTHNISWSSSLIARFESKRQLEFDENNFRIATYRPYQKQWLYFGGGLTHRVAQIPQIFPTKESNNLVISMTGLGTSKDFSCIITDTSPDVQLSANGQCFSLYLYEENAIKSNDIDLFNQVENITADGRYIRKDAISDIGLKYFQDAYPTETFSKEDIFYYVYGLLHSEDYRTRYADNLTKELPRIPCVKKSDDFWAFSKAGRDLAHWHLNYETVEPYKAKLDLGGKSLKQLEDKDFYVTKMKFPKKDQKDTVIYNNAITIREIPLEAYDYVVNGKSALEWVMERQGVSTHKDSGIVNDANDWAIETMGDAKYPLNLFLRVITVSLETMKIVNALPKLDI